MILIKDTISDWFVHLQLNFMTRVNDEIIYNNNNIIIIILILIIVATNLYINNKNNGNINTISNKINITFA